MASARPLQISFTEPLTLATLVLSTVGTALGGPVGGAIGALIGQSFDQQLLGPARRGPRLGDLSVQTSSYGTQVPRIYGTMRVAGSVIWATDLVEGSETTGAKGQLDVTFSYSVSMAVALSSRRVEGVKRIWADGKLLRGEEGDFKVGTTYRFYDGSEDQAIDPLIGSIEDIANTPAYRGLALAVFENLELAEFGNRIPFLTFEVVAEDAPSIASILADASSGAIECAADDRLVGFAAYGQSIRAAIDPLVRCYDVPLFDDGSIVRGPIGGSIAIEDAELGNRSDDQPSPRIQREALPDSAMPATLRISYYDPARDYQTGEARASAGEQAGNEIHQELPAVLGASDAKSLAQRMLARQWSARDKLTLRLPPSRTGLEPGTTVQLTDTPSDWMVEKCTLDGFVTIAELRPSWRPAGIVASDPGRILPNPDIVDGPLAIALFDVPNVTGSSAEQPMLLMAAAMGSAGWRVRPVDISAGAVTTSMQTARSESLLGQALTVVGAAEADLADEINSLDVQLVDPAQWLTSCDDEALGAGMNLAVIGNEVIQFANAASLGGGRFRLTRLLRGRWGTECAVSTHATGEAFCLIQPGNVQPVVLPISAIGLSVIADDRRGDTAQVQLRGESVRPWTPVNVQATIEAAGDLALSWTRRSRAGSSWIDEVDVPLGETREDYRVTVIGALASAEFVTTEPSLTIAASDLAALGSGTAQVEVRQIGDWAASRPAQIAITLA